MIRSPHGQMTINFVQFQVEDFFLALKWFSMNIDETQPTPITGRGAVLPTYSRILYLRILFGS